MEENALADVDAALACHGLRRRTIAALSPPSFGKKRERRAFRIELTDGSAITARRFESAAEATRLAELRGRLPAPFTPIIACHGPVLLEHWIEGQALSTEEADTRAAEVGALLGRLHATALPDGNAEIATAGWRERGIAKLAVLVEARVISDELTQVLQAELVRCDPGTAPRAVVHRDYCPENIIVDPAGRLHLIDHEWLGIDAAGADLGRTYCRWLMPQDAWRRFMCGYLTTAPADPGPLRFWMIAIAAAGAVVRLRKSAAELAVPLRRLHELAAAAEPR